MFEVHVLGQSKMNLFCSILNYKVLKEFEGKKWDYLNFLYMKDIGNDFGKTWFYGVSFW